jgi:predicted phosphodiesterase
MKILIASDSHGLTGSLYRIIDTEHPDMLIHLGDMEKIRHSWI